jgi:hypothetical protein
MVLIAEIIQSMAPKSSVRIQPECLWTTKIAEPGFLESFYEKGCGHMLFSTLQVIILPTLKRDPSSTINKNWWYSPVWG